MLDDARVKALQRHWEDGWNKGDLDTIMEPMAGNGRFSSPFVARISGDPSSTPIDGYDAVRAYMGESLRKVPGIRYTLDATYVSPASIILSYTFHLPDGSGRTGADSMQVDAEGQIVDWRSHYPFRAEEIDQFIGE